MKDRALAPLTVLAAAVLAILSPVKASAADPSGIWAKDDGSAKVEIKKCGRGICGSVVWVRNPSDSRGNPLHDVRNENPSQRGRPIIGLPLFSNMRPTEPNTWVGNVYNPVEGHIYTDVKLTLVSRQQIVLRGCKTWLLCGEKTWTRSSLPPDAVTPEQLIEAKATAEPAARERTIEAKATDAPVTREKPIEIKALVEPVATEKAKLKAAPKPAVPTIQASREREMLSAPGFGVVASSVRQDSMPLPGDSVVSLVAMTTPSTPAAFASSPIETAAAEEEWPWMQRRKARRTPAVAQAQVHAVKSAPGFARPKPVFVSAQRPVVVSASEPWPWQQRRARTIAPVQAPPAATMPVYVRPAPQPVAMAPQPWQGEQRPPVFMVATQASVY